MPLFNLIWMTSYMLFEGQRCIVHFELELLDLGTMKLFLWVQLHLIIPSFLSSPAYLSLSLSLCSIISISAIPPHFITVVGHPASEADRAELAARGVDGSSVRPLGRFQLTQPFLANIQVTKQSMEEPIIKK